MPWRTVGTVDGEPHVERGVRYGGHVVVQQYHYPLWLRVWDRLLDLRNFLLRRQR